MRLVAVHLAAADVAADASTEGERVLYVRIFSHEATVGGVPVARTPSARKSTPPAAPPVDDPEKLQRALNLRKAGAGYDQIAQQVGYPDGDTAHRAVADALIEGHRDTAQDEQRLEVQRLDQMLMALWPKAMQGQGWAADRIFRLMELRREYDRAALLPARSSADPVENRRTVVDAVKADLADLPEKLQLGALAASALELARTIDQGLNQATCTKELRAVLAELREQAPLKPSGDAVDDLNERRAARQRAASGT